MHYRLHGLTIVSDRAIPGLSASEPFDDPDLTFRFRRDPFPLSGTVELWFNGALDASGRPVLVATRSTSGDFLRLAYCEGITFTIDRHATAVWIDLAPHLTIADVPTYLLGPIIGLVLRLRGLTSLHASSVEIDGRAVVFTGPAGAGKSTLAGAFAVQGFRVMADDTVALRQVDGIWTASAGYPRLRLWPEAADALMARGGDAGFLPPGVSGSTSRYHLDLMSSGRTFCDRTLPLGAVYVLSGVSDDNAPAITALASVDAVITLTANTYANQLLDRELRAREFEVLTDIVARVPVRRLTRPGDLAQLDALCACVRQDLDRCIDDARLALRG